MTTLQASAQKQLRQLVEQIERLLLLLEAKAVGFDVKIMREVVRLRKKSKAERDEQDSVLEVYLHALGMLDQAGEQSERMIAAE